MSVDAVLDQVVAGEGACAVRIDGAVGARAVLSDLAKRARIAGRSVFRVEGSAALHDLPFGALGGMVRLSGGDPPALMAQACRQIAALGEPVVVIDHVHLLDPLSAISLHQSVLRGAVRVVALASRSQEVSEGAVRAFIDALPVVTWKGGGGGERPPTVRSLHPLHRRLLQALALAGDLSLDDAERLFGSEATAAVESAGLVRVQAVRFSARVTLAERAVADEALAELGAADRDRLCADLVRALRTRTDSDPRRLIQSALVMRRGSVAEYDPGLLVQAAQAAHTVGNIGLARELARLAVDAGAGAEGVLVLAEALTWSGAADDAEARLADLAAQDLEDATAVRVAAARAANLHCNLCAGDRALAVVTAARERFAQSPHRDLLDALMIQFSFFAGDLATVLRDGLPMVEMVDIDSPAMVWLTSATANALSAAGRFEEAERHARLGFAASERSASGTQRFTLGLALTDSALARGRVDEALRICDDLYARAAGEPQATGIVDALAGRVAIAAGDIDGAVAAMRRAAQAARSGATPVWQAVVAAWLADTASTAGQREEAVAACEFAIATMPPYVHFFDVELHVARAGIAGDDREAVRHLERAVAGAHARGDLVGELRMRIRLVWLGARDQVAVTAALATRLDTPLVASVHDYAVAMAERDARALRAESELFADRGWGMGVRDARVAAEAEAAPSYEGLSAREREVIKLVVAGRTNREVAEVLGVALRTVEGHLYRIYPKAGVANRRELVARFG
ncbi:helix-turn-helix transcriptional regulator [Tsukamurella pseudospumae]|uniref:helix-turn-helix transcriptional regulator n=1 Tax=Tsukamurella pseudospumae TaxID=239498 RepID=UPI000AF7B164|nr:helix-turn-helix transcriptional regulator [Tsukamurella pseudospumae]